MKKFAWLLILPLVAVAAVADDYAARWPLALERPDGGAYRVVLAPDVYRQLQSSDLRDLVVTNAAGQPVATAVFPPDAPLAQAGDSVALAWFPLPGDAGATALDIAAISEVASDGSLRRVELRGANPDAAGDSGFVIDASRLREPVAALRFSWSNAQAFDRGYRVSASDDLRQWREIEPDGRLVQLRNGDRRVIEDRIALPGVRAKYLRLQPNTRQPAPLALTSVRAELAGQVAAPALQWEQLQGRRVEDRDGVHFEYALAGRFPVEAADVVAAGNSTRGWLLQSRDGDDAAWQTAAAPWVAYRLDSSEGSSRSPPQPLDRLVRDRQWRLQARSDGAQDAPVLRLGYRPEVVLFLAEGQPPFALLAGSARAARPATPLPQLIETLRAARGKDWQPAVATLGQREELAGAAALRPGTPIDWKRWLLWALLLGGALLVAGFAASLLRKRPPGG
ncbi:DUF3999 domain-containing protein [Thermomonas fusca]|uniref:DUF3999 domain-containing protein n=1 Tax=Thermomonas fusca TaxID=215690 RepID=UPI0003FE0740|nr:DUF3999 domain-containing protein [Thermomonas fusca]